MKAAAAVGGLIARWTALVCRVPRAIALAALVVVLGA